MSKTEMWPKEEINLLLRIFSTATLVELKSAFPNRSATEIRRKAATFGLRRGISPPRNKNFETFRPCEGVTITRHKLI